ncbi:hypothetical protein [Salmonella enterica]|uniref:hypothetical protein n=1 Tax=Salmonella enterica TaxID=28901 RepID=UPI0002F6ED7C|nr:hypothetical protein [Salmonella enterica]
MNKKHTNHHLLKINDIKTESYNMMMMHENQKCAKSRAAAAPWQTAPPGVPF